MKKVLFLPFLQIKTGHHHVAEALTEEFLANNDNLICQTREILSDRFGQLEFLVSKTYLQWIHHFPESYHWLYKKMVYNDDKSSRYMMYEFLFLSKMKSILNEEKPDLIICTHALPSYILSQLKKRNKINIPIINVYTDFFVHNLWGKEHIDYHFVATEKMKSYLMSHGVSDKNIFISGIPTHRKIKVNQRMKERNQRLKVLIGGGSLGIGFYEEIIPKLKNDQITYYILCGRNKDYYNVLKQRKLSHIVPLPFIHSKEDMNRLYDHMDAIITKPGGVTVSECFKKQLPIFVYDALPGQEQINLKELSQLGLIFYSEAWKENGQLEKDLVDILYDDKLMKEYEWRVKNHNYRTTNEHPVNYFNDFLTQPSIQDAKNN